MDAPTSGFASPDDLQRWARVTADTLRRMPGPGPVEAPLGEEAQAALDQLRRDPPKRGERLALLVGGGEGAARLVAGLEARGGGGIRLAGFFDDRDKDRAPPAAGCPRLGSIDEVIAFARAADIGLVIVTLPLSAERRIMALMRRLWVLPADIRLSAYSQDFAFRDFGLEDGPLIPVLRRPISGLGHRVKRAIDVLGAAGALLILAPALLAIALAVRLESRGPILFRQPRHGFNDQVFQVLKFRSMRAEDCDPEAKRIVVRDDPRVTRVGAILRRTSLDELPQLWNVLRGDMSLVGPRPHALEARSSREELFTRIVDGYSGRHRARPGITGLAQIEGWRGEVDGPEALRRRFEADLRYIENWSLWLDLRILASTVPALLTTTRAY